MPCTADLDQLQFKGQLGQHATHLKVAALCSASAVAAAIVGCCLILTGLTTSSCVRSLFYAQRPLTNHSNGRPAEEEVAVVVLQVPVVPHLVFQLLLHPYW